MELWCILVALLNEFIEQNGEIFPGRHRIFNENFLENVCCNFCWEMFCDSVILLEKCPNSKFPGHTVGLKLSKKNLMKSLTFYALLY